MQENKTITLIRTVYGGKTKERGDTLMTPELVPDFIEAFGEELSRKTTLLILEGGLSLASDNFKVFEPGSTEHAQACIHAFGSAQPEIKCPITIADYRDAKFRKEWGGLMRSIIDSKAVTFSKPLVIPSTVSKDQLETAFEKQTSALEQIEEYATIDWTIIAEKVFSSSRANVGSARKNIQGKVLAGCDEAIIDAIKHFKNGYARIIAMAGRTHSKAVSEKLKLDYQELVPEEYNFTPEFRSAWTDDLIAAFTLSKSDKLYDEALNHCTLD